MVSSSQALDIVFDYTYDSGGFFGSAGSDQRLALEEAASFFETNFGDDLDAITPGDGNSWSAVFFDPTNISSNISVNNLSVAADTMVIFVGSEDRGATNLGLAAPGGYNVSAVTTGFLTAVTTRGETGMTSGTADDDTDFGAWGGAISFNDNAAIDWNFDAFSEPAPTEYDFLSTALHEIAHVFGFATSESYERLINVSDEFTGANAVAENGGVVQLTIDGHIDASEMSTVFGTATSQVPIMSDSSVTGSRELMTDSMSRCWKTPAGKSCQSRVQHCCFSEGVARFCSVGVFAKKKRTSREDIHSHLFRQLFSKRSRCQLWNKCGQLASKSRHLLHNS